LVFLPLNAATSNALSARSLDAFESPGRETAANGRNAPPLDLYCRQTGALVKKKTAFGEISRDFPKKDKRKRRNG
jgi:hypothetical protein